MPLRSPVVIATALLSALILGSGGLTSTAYAVNPSTAAPGIHEETAPAIAYTGTWRSLSQQASSGGAIAYASGTATASLSFLGPGVTWYGWKAPSAGIAEVYIDGQLNSTVDNYASSIKPRSALFSVSDLGPGVHTIEIRPTNTKNPAATGKNVHLDYFDVAATGPATYEESSPNVQYTGSWNQQGSGWASGSALVYASGVATASLTFQGSNINWYTWKNSTAGIADVYLDGVLQTTVDNYAPSAKYRVRAFTAQDLSPGIHTIEIRATGTKNPSSTGRNVHFDSFVVGAPPAPQTDPYASPAPPAATVTVSTAAQLTTALAAAVPGTAIQLSPGTYVGDFRLNASGTVDQPIWLFGPRDAILRNTSTTTGAALRISGSYLRLSGFTAEQSMQGVMVTRGSNVIVADLNIRDIGQEGLHFYLGTSDSRALNNLIERTGTENLGYGEGIYIGTSPENWGRLTEGKPDTADRNIIAGNVIRIAGAEPIEAKPGTTGGIVANNTIEGYQPGSVARAWVLVSGNDWTITGNTGTDAVTDGYATRVFESWGVGNRWSDNTGTLNASGYGLKFLNGAPPGTVVTCDNDVTNAESGLANVFCTP